MAAGATVHRTPSPAAAPRTPAPPPAAARASRVGRAMVRTPFTDAAPPALRLKPAAGRVGFSGGEPIASAVRSPIERTLGVDLSDVRVHTGGRASAAAAALNARAFAYGTHIALAPGEQPSNLRLMAHEAAHVVQQQ